MGVCSRAGGPSPATAFAAADVLAVRKMPAADCGQLAGQHFLELEPDNGLASRARLTSANGVSSPMAAW